MAAADGNRVIQKYYIYGKELLELTTPVGRSYCYHFDSTGHTIALTDETQTIVNTYAYDPYGNPAGQQEAVVQPFKYAGQFGVMAEPNGFYYMRARYYDPKAHRFISEDPLGFDGGDTNLMTYVGGNPVMGVDPEGLQSPLPPGAPFIAKLLLNNFFVQPLLSQYISNNEAAVRILSSGISGAVVGGGVGTIAGATGGLAFMGVGAAPGATIGGVTGSICGFAGGLLTGSAAEIARPYVSQTIATVNQSVIQTAQPTSSNLSMPSLPALK